MKKYFAAFMMMTMLAIMLPLAAFGQTNSSRRVYRNGRWQSTRVYTNPGRRVGWTRNNRDGWNNRNRGITPQEQRRLSRQRSRIGTLRNRINRDGVITNREYRKLDKRTDKYVWKVRKARNN
jgi:hypothetical protein